MTRVPFARTVVWRHPCDCPTASRPLEPGEHAEHRFDVDGAQFPWLIAENGATFRKVCGGLYLVTVCIFPALSTDCMPLYTTFDPDGVPSIGGTPFPWAIGGPVTYTSGPGRFPQLELTFIARHVDADIDIPEEETNEAQP